MTINNYNFNFILTASIKENDLHMSEKPDTKVYPPFYIKVQNMRNSQCNKPGKWLPWYLTAL